MNLTPLQAAAFRRRDWLLALLLVAVTAIAYLPAWTGAPLWDDTGHLTREELRSVDGLRRIWTEPGATQQYYPLVHTVFWVEHRLWGDWPPGYHLLNIVLHSASALLLVVILRRLQIRGAWFAAFIFALHPIEVESVAWISELKNVLSGVFYLGSLLVYLEFDRSRKSRWFAIALGLFVLGLLSKTVIATLPGAILVVFWWRRGKLSWQRDVLPLVPFFVLGSTAGLFTAWVERTLIGAEGSDFNYSILERFLIAGRVIWFYLGKLFWPLDLVFVYPTWQVSETIWWQCVFPAALLLLLGALAWLSCRWRAGLAALLFFILTLFPVLGFLNVYPFRYSFVSDHFQYLASLGMIMLVAPTMVSVREAAQSWRRPTGYLLCLAFFSCLAILTWRQSEVAAVKLAQQANDQTRGANATVLHILAVAYAQTGQYEKAIETAERSLQLASADNNADLAALLRTEIGLYQRGTSIPDGQASPSR